MDPRPRRRFTPTRVGNMSSTGVAEVSFTVHPHACGEYGIPAALKIFHAGSPPRVWGISYLLKIRQEGMRFTPTRVGNISSVQLKIPASSVHPHACGEYFQIIRHFRPFNGSPPRVWGICSPGL